MNQPTPEQQAAIDAAQARLSSGVTTSAGQTFTPAQIDAMTAAQNRMNTRQYDVMKSFADGSQLIMLSNGKMQVINQSQGFSSNDTAVIEAAQRGESPVQAAKASRAETVVQQAPAGARGSSVLKGIPFIGSSIDEFIGGTPREEAQVRLLQESMQTSRPGEAMGLELLGGVAGGSALGMAPGIRQAGTSLINSIKNLPTVRKYLAYAASGLGLGGLEGTIYGYGTGETPEQRISGAQKGGTTGAVVGTATGLGLPMLGNALARGWANASARYKRTDTVNIAKELGISQDAARILKATIDSGEADLPTMISNIERAGEQGMIADADMATKELLDALAATAGGASGIVRGAVEGRATQAGKDLEGTMDQSIVPVPRFGGQAADVQDIAREISESTRIPRQKAYSQAYGTPIDYSKPQGQAINQVLNRVPTRILNKAIQDANDAMKMEGLNQRQIVANLDEQGNLISFSEEPSVTQLDYIKRALGDIGNEVDSVGRPTAEAGRARKLYSQLRGAIIGAAPAYKEAMRQGGDKAGRDTGLLVGESALRTDVTPRSIVRDLADLDEGQRLYAKIGLRDSIQRKIDGVKATIASPDVDINAVREVLKDLSSKANRAKVKTIIGSRGANNLFRELEKAEAALSLRAAVARNSATAVRQSIQKQIDQVAAPGAASRLARGEPFKAVQDLVQTATGETPDYVMAQKSKVMKELAGALTSARGKEAKRQLRVIYNAVKENRATNEQMQQAADFLVNSVTLPSAVFGTAAATRDQQ